MRPVLRIEAVFVERNAQLTDVVSGNAVLRKGRPEREGFGPQGHGFSSSNPRPAATVIGCGGRRTSPLSCSELQVQEFVESLSCGMRRRHLMVFWCLLPGHVS